MLFNSLLLGDWIDVFDWIVYTGQVGFERFIQLLPGNRTITPEVELLLKSRFSSWMLSATKPQDAIYILETVCRYPGLSTQLRVEENDAILLDGTFDTGSSGTADFVRAFDMEMNPLIVKLSHNPVREIEAFESLGLLTWTEALEHHIVPLRLIQDRGPQKRQFLLMPFMSYALEAFPRLTCDLALRGARQIKIALDRFHSQRVFHMDLKPGNILVDRGSWFLADFDSCVYPNPTVRLPQKLTTSYIPVDLARTPCARFDKVMLVVTCAFKIQESQLFNFPTLKFSEFTLKDLSNFIQEIRNNHHEELGSFLLSLLM